MTKPKFKIGQKVNGIWCEEFTIAGMYWDEDIDTWIYHDGDKGWRGYETWEEEEDLELAAPEAFNG